MWNSTGCPSINKQRVAQSEFWSKDGIHWDQHRIGWAISGGFAILTVSITIYSVLRHALNYRVPAEQRQVIRILYMPPIWGIIAFFSYRFFRQYTYYSVSQVVYEAIIVTAFMFLLIEAVASTTDSGTTQAALLKKEKHKLPIPFCCWRYRPTKPYFMYAVKWSVMQYTVIQPIISLISVVTQSFNLLCTSSFSPQFANLWLTIFGLLSNAIAAYGLLAFEVVFYELTKGDLRGRRPAAKFWCVNIIVTIPFIQQLLFSVLQGAGVIKETKLWTSTNVADGLNALVTGFEMVLFSLFMLWAFPVSEYTGSMKRKGSAWRALWDSLFFWDFVLETWDSLKFFVVHASSRRRIHPDCGGLTQEPKKQHWRARFADAFGLRNVSTLTGSDRRKCHGDGSEGSETSDISTLRLMEYLDEDATRALPKNVDEKSNDVPGHPGI